MFVAFALSLLIVVGIAIAVFAVRHKTSPKWSHTDDFLILGLVALVLPVFFVLQPAEPAHAEETHSAAEHVEELGFTIVDGELPTEAGEKTELTVRSQTMEFDCNAYASLKAEVPTDVICEVPGLGNLALEEVAKHVEASV